MNNEQLRAEFEEFMRKSHPGVSLERFATGCYLVSEARHRWEGWAARAALQSQDRVDAERYRYLSSMATQQADGLGPIFRIDVRRTTPQTMFNFDAAVDHARRIEGDK